MFANKSDKTLLSLPIGEHMDHENIANVVHEIKKYYKKNRNI